MGGGGAGVIGLGRQSLNTPTFYYLCCGGWEKVTMASNRQWSLGLTCLTGPILSIFIHYYKMTCEVLRMG